MSNNVYIGVCKKYQLGTLLLLFQRARVTYVSERFIPISNA